MTTTEIIQYLNENHTIEEMLSNPNYSHTRYHQPWDCFIGTDSPYRYGTITVYFRCSDSPSGVFSAGGFILTPENKSLLSQLNVSPNMGPSRGSIASSNPPSKLYL